MLFVNLHIGPELQLAVGCVVKLVATDYVSGAVRGGDPVSRGKHIQPEDAGVYHFDGDSRQNLLERKYGVDASCAFLGGSDVSFDLGDVLITCDPVHGDADPGKFRSDRFKLTVKEQGSEG
jgi:hypothetical protein